MSRPQYPAWGGSTVLKGDHGECRACAQPATHSLRVQNDNQRSEDDVFKVCARHESIGRLRVERLLSHIASKAKFLDNPDALKAEVTARRLAEGGGARRTRRE